MQGAAANHLFLVAWLGTAQTPYHVHQRILTGDRVKALHIDPHRIPALYGTVAQLIGQRTAQFVDEGCAPPMGFEDRQATVALANDDLRAIDLGRHADRLDLNHPDGGP
ncbi:hypothetical protein D3C87_1854630 [compost metagenome]